MNLPFLKKFNKKVLPLYFLVLILRDEKAEALIFEELGGKAKVVGQKEEYFSSTIDNILPDEFLKTLDKAISGAESSLPENIQTQKTIFGVKESWTVQDQIKKEYLAKLKKASEELDLIPIGFLVISQAIAHLLQKEEGVPVSAILVEANKKNITTTLLRAGKIIETKSSEIHESIPFTVDTLLKHFSSSEILPSRIIIFNGKEDLSQHFISHTWSKSLPFLHLPQITSLPYGFDIKSVLFGAASQLGFEILEGGMPKEQIEDETFEEKMRVLDEKPVRKPKLYNNLDASDFGFAKDIDVAKVQTEKLKEEIKEPTIEFVNEDIANINNDLELEPNFEQTTTKSPKGFNNFLAIAKNIFVGIFETISTLTQKLNIKKSSSLAPKGKLGLIISGVVIFIAALLLCYFFFLKATVTLIIDPEITTQEKEVLFSTIKDTNSSENIIKGEFVSVSEEGSASTPATGKKNVGTNAKGSVTIFNRSKSSKTLTSKTEITSPNGLVFTLDNSVTLASASSSVDSNFNETIKPSTSNVNITANQLGKESNLPSGTKFTIASFDTADLVAKNDNPFSGGSKKEVTVASKTDTDKLAENLLKQLEGKAREDLQSKLSASTILLPNFITETLTEESYNVKIGDEASKLTLDGTVEYQGLTYNKDDLIEFSKSFSKDIPSNQTIDYKNIKATALDIKQKNDDEIEAKLNIKTLLLPKLDENNLTKEIKNKSFTFTEDALYKLPNVANVEIKLSPNIPFLPKKLPLMEKNIKILIKING
jgi:hypothetical protein